MYISERFKEGIIYDTQGNQLAKIRCRASATDENIYKTLKTIAPLVEAEKKLYRVNTVFKNILDEAPIADKPHKDDAAYEDSPLIVPKNTYILKNMIFTDEEIYGADYDGKKRTYRILWKDTKGNEYFVPLEGIDEETAVNPNGAYSYNSETKELSFAAFMPYDTEYILRRYIYE